MVTVQEGGTETFPFPSLSSGWQGVQEARGHQGPWKGSALHPHSQGGGVRLPLHRGNWGLPWEALPLQRGNGAAPAPWGTLLFPGLVGSSVLLIKAPHSHPQPGKLI